LKLGYYSQLVS